MRLKKRKDGRYLKSFVFIDENGSKRRKYVYGYTVKELEEKYLEAIEVEKEKEKRATSPGSEITVGEWAQTWLDTYKSGVAYNTRKMYEINVHTYIIPAMGHLHLNEVQLIHIQNLLNTYKAKGLHRTAQTIYVSLNQMFEVARKSAYISTNPTLDVERPKYRKPDKRALTELELEIINNAPLTLKEMAFVLLLLHTGLRRGEATALTLADVDMKSGMININKSLYHENNRALVKDPKTKAGMRIVPILDELKPALAQYLLSMNSQILFPAVSNGAYMSQTSFRRFWNKIIRKITDAGITANDITPHIFRHTYTSRLVKNGVSIKDAQYVLGHSSAKVTLDIYAHFDPKAPQNVKDLLNGSVIELVL